MQIAHWSQPMPLLYGTSGGIPSSGFNRILVATARRTFSWVETVELQHPPPTYVEADRAVFPKIAKWGVVAGPRAM